MNPQEIIEHLCDNTDKETIFVTDVGQHQMWAAQYVKQTAPRNSSYPAEAWVPWASATEPP